jgi:hypothetical protein
LVIVLQDSVLAQSSSDPLNSFAAVVELASRVSGPSYLPPLSFAEVSKVLSGAILIESAIDDRLSDINLSVSSFMTSQSTLSAIVSAGSPSLSNQTKLQLAFLDDCVNALFRASLTLTQSGQPITVTNSVFRGKTWSSNSLAAQLRQVSFVSNITLMPLAFSPFAPSAYLQDWNQSAGIDSTALLASIPQSIFSSTIAAIEQIAFMLGSSRTQISSRLLNLVAFNSSASSPSLPVPSLATSLVLIGTVYSPLSASSSVGFSWSSSTLFTSTASRWNSAGTQSVSAWPSLTTWPNAKCSADGCILPPSTVPVTSAPSSRRYFLALMLLDLDLTQLGMRMAFNEMAAGLWNLGPGGDSLEVDSTLVLIDPCDQTISNELVQNILTSRAVSLLPSVILTTCSISASKSSRFLFN